MARHNQRFKTAYNALLDDIARMEVGTELSSETILATRLGVSRTIVRSALERLKAEKIIAWRGRRKRILRLPDAHERFPAHDLEPVGQRIEKKFLEWILRRDAMPGMRLNMSELARQFGVAPHTIQDFLTRFMRFGLIENRGRAGWYLQGFTPEYALDLSNFRNLIEFDAVSQLVTLGNDHPVWERLDALEADHHALRETIDTNFHDFSALDDRFHATITDVTANRFAREFQDLISLVFHYHYQWNKRQERARNAVAIGEHLDYIAALRTRDAAKAHAAAKRHLDTARVTLLESLG